MFKELIEARYKAKQEYDIKYKEMQPYWNAYLETEEAIEREFIKQKLYIPIDKLPEYLKDQDASSFTIVFENGETEELYHDYDISYENRKWKNSNYIPGKIIKSGIADDGYSFSYDSKEEHIVGFYDLKLSNNTEVKETYMEEIISKL